MFKLLLSIAILVGALFFTSCAGSMQGANNNNNNAVAPMGG